MSDIRNTIDLLLREYDVLTNENSTRSNQRFAVAGNPHGCGHVVLNASEKHYRRQRDLADLDALAEIDLREVVSPAVRDVHGAAVRCHVQARRS